MTAEFLVHVISSHSAPASSLSPLPFVHLNTVQPIGKAFLINAEGKTSALVIAEHLAEFRVLLRERKQSVFEACVVGDDRSPLIRLIKIYLGSFIHFLNACDHVFSKTSYFSVLFFRLARSAPIFAHKSLGLHRRYLRFSQQRGSHRATHRLKLSKSLKVHILLVYTVIQLYSENHHKSRRKKSVGVCRSLEFTPCAHP